MLSIENEPDKMDIPTLIDFGCMMHKLLGLCQSCTNMIGDDMAGLDGEVCCDCHLQLYMIIAIYIVLSASARRKMPMLLVCV